MARKKLPWTTEPPPPIEERPICPCCKKRLRPRISKKTEGRVVGIFTTQGTAARGPEIFEKKEYVVVSRAWLGWHAYGHFCTMRCAVNWANRAVDQILGRHRPRGPSD